MKRMPHPLRFSNGGNNDTIPLEVLVSRLGHNGSWYPSLRSLQGRVPQRLAHNSHSRRTHRTCGAPPLSFITCPLRLRRREILLAPTSSFPPFRKERERMG